MRWDAGLLSMEAEKKYHATVMKINPERARQHKIKYDKASRGKVWLNLHHPFLEWDEKKRKEE